MSTAFPPFDPHQLVFRPGRLAPPSAYGRKRYALVLSFPSSTMHPPPPGARAFIENRDWRGSKPVEERMRVLTINELWRLSRNELTDLASKITAALPTFPEGSPQRTAAYINLRNIRFVLARRDFSP